jgi:hypothetical protein
MENSISYKDIVDRCESMAREATPDFPKENTYDAWESFQAEVESIQEDSYSLALELVENTDWVIYTHFGWKILHALPQHAIDDAESQWLELNSVLTIDETCGGTFDIWSLQSAIAFHALVSLTVESIEALCGELLDLAELELSNLEGAD